MHEPIVEWKKRLIQAGAAGVFVLPPPYRRGHFRVPGALPAERLPSGLVLSGKGRECSFFAMTDEALLCSARQAAATDAYPQPEKGPEHTLLWQICSQTADRKAFPLCAEERYLLRFCLDLYRMDFSAAGARRLLREAIGRLDRLYALCLSRKEHPETFIVCARCILAGQAAEYLDYDRTTGRNAGEE